MTKHAWIEIQITQVEPEFIEQSGIIQVNATKEAIEVGKETRVYGCAFCNAVLTKDNMNENCESSN